MSGEEFKDILPGRVGNLTPEQEAALAELQTHYVDHPKRKVCSEIDWDTVELKDYLFVLDDHTLLRFLRARKWDVKSAIEQLDGTLKWRKKYNVDTIIDQPPNDLLHLFDAAVPHVLYDVPDIDGNPIIIHSPGGIMVDLCLKNVRLEDAIACHAYSQELNTLLMKENGRKHGKHIETVTNIFNLDGLQMSHRKLLDVMKVITNADERNYPETLKRSIAINAPGVFTFFWGIVKGFLDPVVASKVCILGNDYKEELAKFVTDIRELPEEVGGERKGAIKKFVEAEVAAEHEKNWRNKEGLQEIVLPKKKSKVLVLHLDSSDDIQILDWWFKTKKKHITFGITFQSAEADSKKQVLKPMAQYNSHELYVREIFRFKVGLKGTIEITFDNMKTSTDRTLWYAIKLTPSKQGVVFP